MKLTDMSPTEYKLHQLQKFRDNYWRPWMTSVAEWEAFEVIKDEIVRLKYKLLLEKEAKENLLAKD